MSKENTSSQPGLPAEHRSAFLRLNCVEPGGLFLVFVTALLVGLPSVTAEEPKGSGKRIATQRTETVSSDLTGSGCRRCHYCYRPTADNKCLVHPCARNEMRKPGGDLHEGRGPSVVILGELEDAYLPVPFDHKGHADMAEMGGGCSTCHHFTPEGQQHPPCKTCHDPSAAGTDVYKPGLKGAYHQQCMNCHREWIDETDCAICHVAKAGRSKNRDVAAAPAKDDLVGRAHPPIPEPDSDFYRDWGSRASESKVVFRHREHVHRFGLTCVECHHESSCARCHTRDNRKERSLTLVEHHRPCLRCHKSDMDGANVDAVCERCHWEKGRPLPARFEHAGTGWPLSRFHEGKSCRQCHAAVPFTKRDTDCNACHSDWKPSSFDHRVTGQELDDNHADADCEQCHIDRRFDRPPVCSECHDEEDDGIAFPAKRPGTTVGVKTAGP